MTIKYADRVLETSTTTGTGSINLGGAAQGFQGFVDGVGDGARVNYFIEDGQSWESGIGTVTAGAPDSLSRDRIISSSAGGAAINWGIGTRNVFLSASSQMVLWRDENGNDVNQMGMGGGTGNAQTVTFDHDITAYSDRMMVRWIASADNTGAMTLGVNGLPAKTYVRSNGSAFAGGMVLAGSLQEAYFDETNDRFIKAGPANGGIANSELADGAVDGPKMATSVNMTGKEITGATLVGVGMDNTSTVKAYRPLFSTAASYTFVAADAGRCVYCVASTAVNFTVPPNASVAFPVGTEIDLFQYGTGQITMVAGSGVTIRSADNRLKIAKQYGGATLKKINTNEWLLCGSLAA